jgi:hypothetical protein
MSNLEVHEALKEYVGTEDTWRKQSPLLQKIKSFVPFQKKTDLNEEIKNLSYIYARKNPAALKQYVLAAQRSQYKEIQSTIAQVKGDKKLALDAYRSLPHNQKLNGLLYFFKTLDYGDTGFENKKFIEFVYGFNDLARAVTAAYEASKALSMPMILEFESSALIPQSPITRLFFKTLANHPKQFLKIEITPDNGRLVSIHPFYAQKIASNVELFAEQFQKRVKFARTRLTSDKTVRQSIVDLIRYGEGLGGLFYTDEKIVEVVLNTDSPNLRPNLACSQLFR